MLLKLKRRKFQQKKIESRKWLWTLRNDYLSCPFHRQRPLWLLLCHLGLRHHHHQYFRVEVWNFAYFWTVSNTLMLLVTNCYYVQKVSKISHLLYDLLNEPPPWAASFPNSFIEGYILDSVMITGFSHDLFMNKD